MLFAVCVVVSGLQCTVQCHGLTCVCTVAHPPEVEPPRLWHRCTWRRPLLLPAGMSKAGLRLAPSCYHSVAASTVLLLPSSHLKGFAACVYKVCVLRMIVCYITSLLLATLGVFCCGYFCVGVCSAWATLKSNSVVTLMALRLHCASSNVTPKFHCQHKRTTHTTTLPNRQDINSASHQVANTCTLTTPAQQLFRRVP